MATAYITQADLAGDIPAETLLQALTDGETSTPDEVWTAIQDSVADAIHGLLAPRYSYPFPSPVQPTIKDAARVFTLEKLYARRGLHGDGNPLNAAAGIMRSRLGSIGSGKILLDAGDPAPAAPPASRGPVAVTGTGIVASATPGRMAV